MLGCWLPRRTIAFEKVQHDLTNLLVTFREQGMAPPWLREVTDAALYEALETRALVSSPWNKALLLAEKARRDRMANVFLGGVGGALMTGLIELARSLAS
jgi:hypothetical protein